MSDLLISSVRRNDRICWAGQWCRVLVIERVPTGWDDRMEGRWLTIKSPVYGQRRVYYLDSEQVPSRVAGR